MATYKVIQDIEAEDKLLGPLTLKQFVFAAITIICGFLVFWFTVNGLWFLAIPFLPPTILFAVLAAPIGRDQPTDVWLAAQVRFYLKPRKRIWDQSGLKELVTITVPKKIERIYSDGLSQQEVRGRLEALASTIDSRGWAVKNVDLNIGMSPAYAGAVSDRLVDPTSLPQSVQAVSVTAADDIMDATANPVAQHFDEMVKQSGQAQKNAAIARMQAAIQNPQTTQALPDYSFINTPPAAIPANQAVFSADPVVAPGQAAQPSDTFLHEKPTPIDTADQALLDKIHKEKEHEKNTRNPHHKTLKTPEELAAEEAEQKKAEQLQAQAMTPKKNPVNIELAKDAGDLKISTVANMAKHANSTEGELRIQH